jgi:hypothetical protein
MNFLIAALAVMTLVTAAPTTTTSSDANWFKLNVLDAVLEDVCFDLSAFLCVSAANDKSVFGKYTSVNGNGFCTCAELPSDYIVRQNQAFLQHL